MRRVSIAALGVVLVSCAPEVTEVTVPDEPLVRFDRTAQQDTSAFLPYGTPIPAGAVLTKPPRPYDRAELGLPLPNTMPGANLALDPTFKLPRFRTDHGRGAQPAEPLPPPGTGNTGYEVYLLGIQARNDAQQGIQLPHIAGHDQQPLLYAPTHVPRPSACIEATTVHRVEYVYLIGWQTRHYQGWWDWCNGEYFRVFELMDATWLSNYTRYYSDYNGDPAEPAMFVELLPVDPGNPDGGCWNGMLYNFSQGYWERKIQSCGTSGLVSRGYTQGWTMWESYGLDEYSYCPSIPNITAANLMKYTGYASWDSVQSGDMTRFTFGYCWTSGPYTMAWPVATEWDAHTYLPPPLAVYVTGLQQISLHQSAQYTAHASGGAQGYTYQWQQRTWWQGIPGSWSPWYSTGSTNYTYASINGCGIDAFDEQVRVTDSQGATATNYIHVGITNPCY